MADRPLTDATIPTATTAGATDLIYIVQGGVSKKISIANLIASLPKFDYIQDADPGAVGAGKWWAKKVDKTIYRRNDANTGWDPWTGVFGP